MNKLTKIHFILMAVLVAVLAAGVFFTFSYRKAEAQQPDIQDEITLALIRLETAKQENDPTDLQAQLAELQKTLNSITRDEPLFPEKPPMVEIGGLLIDTIDKLDPRGTGSLELSKLKPDDDAGTVTIKSTEDAEGTKYNKAEFDITVEGDLGRIVSFIGEIEGAEFATLVVEDLEIEFQEEEEEEDYIIPAYWTADFTIVTLYQYQED